jgi:hypothetical protein
MPQSKSRKPESTTISAAPGPKPLPARRSAAARPVVAVTPPLAGGGPDPAVAIAADAAGGVVTARRAGGLRDLALNVNPQSAGAKAALQHMAKAVNIAFQTDYGENYLESVYQAAIVRKNEIQIIHREYFGFGSGWFAQFGMLVKSLQLTLQGPDPASPEGQQRIAEKGPSTLRGLLNLIGRKLDLVAEYEDRVPAYDEQMFDRMEGSGIIVGWNRDDWSISTTNVGLNVRIVPKDRKLKS